MMIPYFHLLGRLLFNISSRFLWFSFPNAHAMSAMICCRLCGLPTTIFQHVFIFQQEYLYLQGTTAFLHLLSAIVTKPPQRQVTSWTATYIGRSQQTISKPDRRQ